VMTPAWWALVSRFFLHGLIVVNVVNVGMAGFRLIGDAITKRIGPVRTLRAGALLTAMGLTLALTATSATAALPGFALTGAGFSAIVPSKT